MIQTYTFDGTGRQIDASAQFCRYESASDVDGQVEINIWVDGTNIGRYNPGDNITLPFSVKRWEIRPVSANCVGTVRIGNANVTSTKLEGIVQMVEGGWNRSVVGKSFSGYLMQAAAAAAYSRVQLLNESASKYMVVNRLKVSASASGLIGVYGTSSAIGGAAITAGKCKRVSSPTSSVGFLHRDTTPTAQTITGVAKAFQVVGGVEIEYVPSEPFILNPGRGLTIWSDIQNADISGEFDWFEENS